MPATIASWSANPLDVRLPHLTQSLQETRLEDPKFSRTALAEPGYRSVLQADDVQRRGAPVEAADGRIGKFGGGGGAMIAAEVGAVAAEEAAGCR